MVAFSDTLFNLSGYHFTQIYLSSKTIVYRGIREQDQKSVIIKLMRNEYPTFNEIAQFRNQYTITKNLNLAGIVKPYSLDYRNGYALVLEFGGISLKEEMERWREKKEHKNPNYLQNFFHIAREITSTLEALHRSRIIHKDIKPANILINPSTLEVKLIDFSIASVLPKEIQFLTNSNVLEGTLAYISPEQTGRMNRGIDYRTDFYSLGITFFELLTDKLPFITTDPMELVYSHIAKEPPKASLINPIIPPILSEIISKLIAKNAEERYQTASGLKHDLEVCRHQWQENENMTFLELAQQDISDRFLISEKLYGRQNEVKTLLTAFERVTSGTIEMILIAGSSGIGKTAIVNEIQKPIVRQRSYFIKGKFDQLGRDIPLSALIQAFRDLIKQLLSETDDLQYWKAKILSVLGEQGKVITDVIPELESIIGIQPPVPEVSGNAIENRFNLLFKKIIQVFTTKDHPLVIFLDDLQWADSASLKFIQLLINELNTTNKNLSLSSLLLGEAENNRGTEGGILLIGAYRDNEVFKAHPLELTIKEIEQAGTIVNTITLEPLNQGDLNHLIAETLRCEEKEAIYLSQMVFAKTKGNPLFTQQFIKSLHSDKIIEFNLELGQWQWDISQVQELVLTDDVVECMTRQLVKLPSHTQKVLQLAACIGNEFDLKTLTIIYEESAVDTASDLWQALIEGLVFPQANFCQIFENDKNSKETNKLPITNSESPKYKFVHDRVQQAAYSLIPEDKKQLIHLEIAELLLRNIPVEQQEENIFVIVNQLNMALPLITLEAERDGLARMNLIAGRKALSSTAYSAAVKYLATGIQLLTDDCWERKYQIALGLYETAVEATYLSGDFEQMEQLKEVVLKQAKTFVVRPETVT